jgi:hypothetical protein
MRTRIRDLDFLLSKILSCVNFQLLDMNVHNEGYSKNAEADRAN